MRNLRKNLRKSIPLKLNFGTLSKKNKIILSANSIIARLQFLRIRQRFCLLFNKIQVLELDSILLNFDSNGNEFDYYTYEIAKLSDTLGFMKKKFRNYKNNLNNFHDFDNKSSNCHIKKIYYQIISNTKGSHFFYFFIIIVIIDYCLKVLNNR